MNSILKKKNSARRYLMKLSDNGTVHLTLMDGKTLQNRSYSSMDWERMKAEYETVGRLSDEEYVKVRNEQRLLARRSRKIMVKEAGRDRNGEKRPV